MAVLASDLLWHFQLLLWNRGRKFNETWQEARSQHPLPSLCFSGRLEKQDGRPGLWLPRHFQLLLRNRRKEFNDTWQKARSQRPLTSLYFSGGSVNKKWPPWPIPQKGGILYSDAQYVALWASCLHHTIFFLCCLWSIAAHSDHFVPRLSICHRFLVVKHSYVCRWHMHSLECCHYFWPSGLDFELRITYT